MVDQHRTGKEPHKEADREREKEHRGYQRGRPEVTEVTGTGTEAGWQKKLEMTQGLVEASELPEPQSQGSEASEAVVGHGEPTEPLVEPGQAIAEQVAELVEQAVEAGEPIEQAAERRLGLQGEAQEEEDCEARLGELVDRRAELAVQCYAAEQLGPAA
jgi:hypothetical protein